MQRDPAIRNPPVQLLRSTLKADSWRRGAATMPSIAFLESSALIRTTLGESLRRAGLQVSSHADPTGFLHHVEQTQPPVALIDLHGLREGVHLIGLLRLSAPATRVVVLTWGDDGVPVNALVDLGVNRLLDGRSEELSALLSAVGAEGAMTLFPAEAFFEAAAHPQRSRPQLSPRERQVLGCVTAGYDNLKIAAELGICERTVKAHVSALYRKLLVENRSQLVLRGLELGLAPVRSSDSSHTYQRDVSGESRLG